jgi:tetratricopeptide (TPR) repeat protein
LLHFVQKRTGFNTFSTAWGAAWAALLLSDWLRAEAMLEKALKYQPEETTLLPLLAIAQYHRGKFQSSIINARHACEADPASLEKAKFLIARWLDGGYAREAQRKLQQFQSDLETDTDLMVSMAQLQLLLHNVAGAAQWTERAKQAKAPAQTFVRLGRIHETARLPDQAANLYQEALSGGHYPEAHLGLGRLEAERNNRAEARKHLLAALNVESPVGKSGANTWQLLQPTLTQLNGLEDPIPGCRAWIAKVPPNALPAAVAGQQFMVYATELSGAQQYLQSMFLAFQPGKPPVILSPNTFRPAPRPIQPEGPVCPGVQGLWH